MISLCKKQTTFQNYLSKNNAKVICEKNIADLLDKTFFKNLL